MNILTKIINKLQSPKAPTPKMYSSQLSEQICKLLADPATYHRSGSCIKFKDIDLYICCDDARAYHITLLKSSGSNFLTDIPYTDAEIRPLAQPILLAYYAHDEEISQRKKQAEQQILLDSLNAAVQPSVAKAKIKEKMKSL